MDVKDAVKVGGLPTKPRSTVVDAWIDFTGGTIGGVACVYIGQPFDTIKVKMQTFPSLYKNAWFCFKTTFKQDGIARGLYSGTVPALAANVSESAILFLCYGACQKCVAHIQGDKEVSSLSPLENALSGGTAAFFTCFTLCPTELVKCRLQAMREMSTKGGKAGLERLKIGPYGLTKEILKAEGIRGLYKGLTATFLLQMPGYFFFFGGYEIAREVMTPHGKTKDEIGPLKTIVAGGIGGVALWVMVFPADVVKSRVQVSAVAGSGQSSTFRFMFMDILKRDGPKALYVGLGPTLVRTFPATGGQFLAYETTKTFLNQLHDFSTRRSI